MPGCVSPTVSGSSLEYPHEENLNWQLWPAAAFLLLEERQRQAPPPLSPAVSEKMNAHQKDISISRTGLNGGTLSADALLLEQIRSGDPDAGRRFVREYYPGVYRYLLYLTGRPDWAEDLTQETFYSSRPLRVPRALRPPLLPGEGLGEGSDLRRR